MSIFETTDTSEALLSWEHDLNTRYGGNGRLILSFLDYDALIAVEWRSDQQTKKISFPPAHTLNKSDIENSLFGALP